MKEKKEDTQTYVLSINEVRRLVDVFESKGGNSIVSMLAKKTVQWVESEYGALYALEREEGIPEAIGHALRCVH